MSTTSWGELVFQSVKDPALAARQILTLGLPRDALWTGLLLMAALNALLFSLSNLLIPIQAPMPAILTSPLGYFAFVAFGLTLAIHAIFYSGRWLGGMGRIEDIMAVMVWLQVLRVLVQALALVLVLVAPMMSAMLVVGASMFGLYVLVHFVNESHQLGSVTRAIGVLLTSLVLMVIVLSLVISLFGRAVLGPVLNV